MTRARASIVFLRATLCALLLPLGLSGTLPVFARALGGPAVHVCRCEARGGHATCACPICHPDRSELRLGKASIRGQCGDEDPVFGGALALALPPPATVAILKPRVSAPPVPLLESAVPGVAAPPPTPPPRLSLV